MRSNGCTGRTEAHRETRADPIVMNGSLLVVWCRAGTRTSGSAWCASVSGVANSATTGKRGQTRRVALVVHRSSLRYTRAGVERDGENRWLRAQAVAFQGAGGLQRPDLGWRSARRCCGLGSIDRAAGLRQCKRISSVSRAQTQAATAARLSRSEQDYCDWTTREFRCSVSGRPVRTVEARCKRPRGCIPSRGGARFSRTP